MTMSGFWGVGVLFCNDDGIRNIKSVRERKTKGTIHEQSKNPIREMKGRNGSCFLSWLCHTKVTSTVEVVMQVILPHIIIIIKYRMVDHVPRPRYVKQ